MLVAWKAEQEETREELGSEYLDYNLVMASPIGTPTEASAIHRAWKHLIEENDLPKVVFHSLRHTSITYKLKLNGGDIKAVQGDSGHAQAKMVTDQYSHILDKDRKENARLVEEAFYGRHGAETPQEPEEQTQLPASQPAGLDAEMLAKILNTPELSMLLKVLATKL